jgi:hypothetical protein
MNKVTPLVLSLLALLLAVVFPACSADENARRFELEPPRTGEGFVLETPEFDVPAGTEVQDCYFVAVPDIGAGQDIWISRTAIGINPGSHHVNVFRVGTILALDPAKGDKLKLGANDGTVVHGGECFKSSNWADWPLVINSQASSPDSPITDWQLPPGVAHRFHPGELLMMQVHYVNAATQKTKRAGRVGVSFYRSAASSPQELGTLFATQQSIRICPSNPTPSFSSGCRFPDGEIHITAVNGHFHSRGTRFRVFAWDGLAPRAPSDDDTSLLYENTTWDDPPMKRGMDVIAPARGGIRWTCEYQWRLPEDGCEALDAVDKENAKGCCYSFGPKVEVNEHCNVFVYYWPKKNARDISCN